MTRSTSMPGLRNQRRARSRKAAVVPLRSSGRASTQASRGRIIDGHMHEIPTRAAVAATRPPAAGTVAGPVEAPELLDIEMEQPAGACPCGQRRTGAGGSSRPSRLGPARQSQRATVERARPGLRAISAPVRRRLRRRCRTTATTRSGRRLVAGGRSHGRARLRDWQAPRDRPP